MKEKDIGKKSKQIHVKTYKEMIADGLSSYEAMQIIKFRRHYEDLPILDETAENEEWAQKGRKELLSALPKILEELRTYKITKQDKYERDNEKKGFEIVLDEPFAETDRIEMGLYEDSDIGKLLFEIQIRIDEQFLRLEKEQNPKPVFGEAYVLSAGKSEYPDIAKLPVSKRFIGSNTKIILDRSQKSTRVLVFEWCGVPIAFNMVYEPQKGVTLSVLPQEYANNRLAFIKKMEDLKGVSYAEWAKVIADIAVESVAGKKKSQAKNYPTLENMDSTQIKDYMATFLRLRDISSEINTLNRAIIKDEMEKFNSVAIKTARDFILASPNLSEEETEYLHGKYPDDIQYESQRYLDIIEKMNRPAVDFRDPLTGKRSEIIKKVFEEDLLFVESYKDFLQRLNDEVQIVFVYLKRAVRDVDAVMPKYRPITAEDLSNTYFRDIVSDRFQPLLSNLFWLISLMPDRSTFISYVDAMAPHNRYLGELSRENLSETYDENLDIVSNPLNYWKRFIHFLMQIIGKQQRVSDVFEGQEGAVAYTASESLNIERETPHNYLLGLFEQFHEKIWGVADFQPPIRLMDGSSEDSNLFSNSSTGGSTRNLSE